MHYDLKKLRKKLGIKAQEIADRFNVTRQTVYYWERKKQYPEYVKDWMEEKLKERMTFEAEADLQSIAKRLARIERIIGRKTDEV